ncbi:MAG: peptidylprolyl isomerase [Candidatus Norongarragalinales archaeon]
MKEFVVLLLVSFLLAGCVSTQNQASPSAGGNRLKAQNGDLVAVDYLGTLDDGRVFDTSIKSEAEKAGLPLRPSYAPLEFTVGGGQMIKGFDNAVVGMAEGEEKTVKLEPADAYGEKRADLIVEIPASSFGDRPPRLGDKLQSDTGMVAVVVNVSNRTITIDANHALAGKTLTFKIIMRKITRK